MKNPLITIITNEKQTVIMTITTKLTPEYSISSISFNVINVLDNKDLIKYQGDNLTEAIDTFNKNNI